MKAVAYRTPGPIDREDALHDITLETPEAVGRDLLVKINAVSVNPVDTKLRLGVAPEGEDWRILGFDAAGVVESVGPEVRIFKPGDVVFYAGSIARPGAPGFVFSTTQTGQHFADIVELIAPQGRFGLIDDPEKLDAMPLKLKGLV